LWKSIPLRREILTVAGLMVIAAFAACAWKQTAFWKNSETLWSHALAVTGDNDTARANLGLVLMERDRPVEAIAQFRKALQIRSANKQPHYNLSLALIHTDLGNALARIGSAGEAMEHFQEAIDVQPDYPDAHYNLAVALAQQGDVDAAIAQWRTTLSLRPDDAEAHAALGNALVGKGSLGEAIFHYDAALTSAPHSATTLNNLAWLLSTCPDPALRNGPRAIELAQRAVQYAGGNEPAFLRTLAAAYAEAGRFGEAVETAQRALQLVERQNNSAGMEAMRKDIERYRAHSPLREPGN
jgi:tetratricopeptide (TPR) repeat protein